MTRIRTIVAGAGVAAGGRAFRSRGRRGVLLLIVLSMLTLFMMLGAAYLAAATRARTAAKAYAKLTFGADEARIPVAPLLDDVLLRVVRGPVPSGITVPGDFESLLEDKYGVSTTTLSGTATVSTTGTSPILTGTLSLAVTGQLRPTDLVGRVLTFVEPGHVATSHRIVRVRNADDPANRDLNRPQTSSQQYEIVLDKPFRSDAAVPVTGRAVPVTVNGREFSGDPASSADKNEPWDGFDHLRNPFLARVAADSAAVAKSAVTKASYLDFPPAANDCDNDGDGVPDGRFFSWDLPAFTDAAGNTVRVDASVLVVDLDGRFNVNAHGSLAPTLYSDNHTGWTQAAGINDTPPNRNRFNDTPMGSGYGPADIQFNGATGTSGTTPNTTGTAPPPKMLDDSDSTDAREKPRLSITVGDDGNRQRGQRPAGSRFGETAATPRTGRVDGKYGEKPATDAAITTAVKVGSATLDLPRPGQPDADDGASRLTDRRALPTEGATVNRGVPPVWWNATTTFNWHTVTNQPDPRGVFNSPPDLHGRMKTLALTGTAGAIVPRVVYAKPEWDADPSAPGAETKDDPYELALDTRRGAGGWLRDPDLSTDLLRHNPFTLAELDPVLRPYDGDAGRQPSRLATMLGTDAEASRLKFTTESWDTTVITGSAALRIYGSGTATSPQGWLQSLPDTVPLHGTSAMTGALSGEVARGEKFDLNRAFDASAEGNAGYQPTLPYFEQRQAYFKDLYTLLVALESGTDALDPADADSLAQWAANVVKFRDADSRIIPFEYEQDIQSNGWRVNNDVGSAGSGATADSGTRKVVWPAVRPEIVIREVFAWHNEMAPGPGQSGLVISLHRPWRAEAHGRLGNQDVQIPAEPCDFALDEHERVGSSQEIRPRNKVDLGKKASAAVLRNTFDDYDALARDIARTNYPIWRLRIVDDAGTETRYVRFDTDTAGTNEVVIPDVSSAATKPKLGTDSTLTLYSGSGNTVALGEPLTGVANAPIDVTTHGGEPRLVPGLQAVAAAITSGTVYLERLSDPSVTLTESGTLPGRLASSTNQPTGKDIWEGKDDTLGTPEDTQVPVRYVVVDAMRFTVNQTGMPVPPPQLQVSRRATAGPTAFWRNNLLPPTAPITITLPATPAPPVPGALTPGETAWFVWPNRPFVSAAELLLVPQGTSEEMLKHYTRPDPANWPPQALGPPPLELPLGTEARALLFDCVHVPTRFSGIHTTTTNDHSTQTGIYPRTTPVNQFSSYREPGRVNLNTITHEQVWNTVVAGPLATPLVSGTDARLGVLPSPTTPPQVVRTMLEALSLRVSGTAVRPDRDPSQPAVPPDISTPIDGVNENPLLSIYTATRLANTVTTRSNVFAVWITLREYVGNDPAEDPDSVRYHRGFYIVDRSVPVGFEEGKDHNVWDCVRLRRVIE
jgi:hypothetical protein